MNNSRFASLSRRALEGVGLAAKDVLDVRAEDGGNELPAAAPVPDEKPEPTPQPTPAPQPAPVEPAPAVATGADASSVRAEERARVSTVMAHDNAKGREAVAGMLLAESDMDADAIIAILPKLGATANNDMLAALAATANPKLGAGEESAPDPKAAENSWSKTFAKLGWTNKN